MYITFNVPMNGVNRCVCLLGLELQLLLPDRLCRLKMLGPTFVRADVEKVCACGDRHI